MTASEIHEEDLQWEEKGELHQPRKEGSSVVQSVRFPRTDIKAIRRAAALAGVSTSEFIRQAAIVRVAEPMIVHHMSFSGIGIGPVLRLRTDQTENAVRMFMEKVH